LNDLSSYTPRLTVKATLNGSALIEKDGSISSLTITIDGSYGDSNIDAGDYNHVIEASGTFTVTFPNNVTQGFQITIVNSGIGTITLDASNLLTTDTFVKLEDQYAGASAVHKSNGTWFSWGNLK